MEDPATDHHVIGFIGLGSIGQCLARRLLDHNCQVIGYDTVALALSKLTDHGGTAAQSVEQVASSADLVILALPTVAAYREVIAQISISSASPAILDINTLLPEEKIAARNLLVASNVMMIDGAISGTPDMVAMDSHSLYVSGDALAKTQFAALFDKISRKVFDVGSFGNAAKIKLVINHLVISHNVVAAEAMSLAVHMGLPPGRAHEVISRSAGSSRIFEVRGGMMVDESYPDADMYRLIVDKDAELIAETARELRHPIPMFSLAVQQHIMAMAQGWSNKEPASLGSMMEQLSGTSRE